MNIRILDNNYIIVPNFINSYRAKELSKEYISHCKSKEITSPISEGDGQAPNCQSDYNYISFLELLCEKTQQVSSIVEETVLPTYCYSRVYYNKSSLKKHIDRDACEVSLTLHLDGDKPWPIYIKTPSGEERSVTLNPGDAMIYLGKKAEHWREEYDGEYYSQVFLHYVRSRGEYSYAYFDKVKDKRSKENDKSQDVSNQLEKKESDISNNTNKDIEKKENVPEKSIEIIVPKPENTLEQYIYVFNDAVSDDLCKLILEEYSNSDEWTDSSIGDKSNPVNKLVRNCQQISLSQEKYLIKNYEKRKKIDEEIYLSVKKSVEAYQSKHPEFQIDIDTGYQLLKYEEGNFYIEHTDSFKEEQRSLSCSLQLNDDYGGGEFAFFNRQMMIKSRRGSAIMFPSNFMFPHEIMPVTKGTRYSIITWLV